MRYIKLYETFSINIMGNSTIRDVSYLCGDNKEQTIRDICLELEDYGYNVIINRYITISEVLFYIDNNNANDMTMHRISFVDIKEYLLRLKDYLGNDYIRFSYLERVKIGHGGGWKSVELNEDTSLDESLGFCIEYKK